MVVGICRYARFPTKIERTDFLWFNLSRAQFWVSRTLSMLIALLNSVNDITAWDTIYVRFGFYFWYQLVNWIVMLKNRTSARKMQFFIWEVLVIRKNRGSAPFTIPSSFHSIKGNIFPLSILIALKTPPEISRRIFWCYKNFRKRNFQHPIKSEVDRKWRHTIVQLAI